MANVPASDWASQSYNVAVLIPSQRAAWCDESSSMTMFGAPLLVPPFRAAFGIGA
jgi:hypothetical protein